VADALLIKIDVAPASDSWGFVGRVLVGEHEAYRTIRSYSTPGDALRATQQLVGDVLGTMLAGQEWRSTEQEVGHAPLRSELQFGLAARRESDQHGDPVREADGGPSAGDDSARRT
jgi:hypothetical protein